MIGKTVSHYKILEKLGGGGMGVVYKAEDTKLDRHVALKFLPPELTRDDEARDRFIHEARSASALDHQHICTIHEINETDDGQTFIAMAFCDGETLKQRIARGPLPAPEAVEIAIQIAEGLAAAHKQEIVHRDIKPANVMLVEDGKVKIVDFGLAKMAGVSKITKAGTTLGTVSYMSPEQARGDPVDHRADIWALGIVFYEMLTGQTPFKGEYEQAVLYSILNAEPEQVTTFQPDLSYDFPHLINKALEKNPKDRYQSVNEMLVDLNRLKRDTSKVVQVPPPGMVAPEKEAAPATAAVIPELAKRARGLSPLQYTGAAALVVILAVAGYFLLRSIGEPQLPQFTNSNRVTTALGVEDYPTWSPEGGRLAYQSDQSGNWDIWVSQIGQATPVNLTEDNTGDDRFPSWSPDGSEIAFLSDRDGVGFYVMSAVGGNVHKVTSYVPPRAPPCWSADGQSVAYIVRDSIGYWAEIVVLQSGDSRRVRLPGDYSIWELSWSPDNRYFVYFDIPFLESPDSRIWLVRAEDGERFPITERESRDASPSWSSDGRYIYFISNRSGSSDLWRQRMGSNGKPIGSAQQLTTGLEIRFAKFSPDGSKLTYSKGQKVSNIWRVPILKDRPATWADAGQLTFEQTFIGDVDVSPDGQRLLFDMIQLGNRGLCVMSVEGGAIRQVTTHKSLHSRAEWSPDGLSAAYHSDRGGNRDIWVVPIAGGPARQVTRNEALDTGAVWSPDGREIAFHSRRSGNADVWIIPVEGGEARQVTSDPAYDLAKDWSPDGKWILFYSWRDKTDRIWRVPTAGGDLEPLTEGGVGGDTVYSTDGKEIYFIATRNETWNIYSIPADGGAERQLTNLVDKPGNLRDVSFAANSQSLFFIWEEDASDIWVMDVDWE